MAKHVIRTLFPVNNMEIHLLIYDDKTEKVEGKIIRSGEW